jgi:O-glycosyl hydrolase
VTLTASVTSNEGTPTGTISFLDGTTTLGNVALSGGIATYSTSTLAPGTHTLSATYAGTATYLGSSSSSLSEVINALATTTALTATPNPAAAAATVTLTATVSASGTTPTGTVTFSDGSTTLGSGTLVNGVTTYSISTLAAGSTHSLTASYAANGNFLGSTSSAVNEVVSLPVTTTALTATPNPAAAGATVTLIATVAAASGAAPTGSVSFSDGSTTLGMVTLASGVATYSTNKLAAGATHSLTASYAGSTSDAASVSSAVALVVDAAYNATAAFSFATAHQTIAGFGGAAAFYASYLDSHPNEGEIMTALFDPVKGLGITYLRLQNNYYAYTGGNASTFDTDAAKIVTAANAALGSPVTVLMSAWTPAASLKSNASVDGCTGSCNTASEHGTLVKVSGAYDYADYGQFWLNSLKAYAALGVTPGYISIQNEPDFPASYVGCLFNPTETPTQLYDVNTSYASYGLAVDAVYKAIHAGGLTAVPAMVGPEALSLYDVAPLMTQVPAGELAAVAHHIYNVSSSGGNPAVQVAPMTTLEADYPSTPKWETEYYQSPGFDNAIDIHNALTVANDSVYLYWGLTWPSSLTNGLANDDQGGLIYIDNPFAAQATWAYPAGWAYNDSYYTLKHYSYFIRPGYIRYNATATNSDEDVSVFQSPDGKTTVIVVLNTSATATDLLGLNLSGITYANSAVYRSTFSVPITTSAAERWNSLGAYGPQGISMPPQSAATIVLTN